MLLHVRKLRAGSSSHGFTWEHDGAVVEVPDDVAVELVAIPDGGFSVVEAPADPETETPDKQDEDSEQVKEPAPVKHEVTEPAPAGAELSEAPATVKPAGKPKPGK